MIFWNPIPMIFIYVKIKPRSRSWQLTPAKHFLEHDVKSLDDSHFWQWVKPTVIVTMYDILKFNFYDIYLCQRSSQDQGRDNSHPQKNFLEHDVKSLDDSHFWQWVKPTVIVTTHIRQTFPGTWCKEPWWQSFLAVGETHCHSYHVWYSEIKFQWYLSTSRSGQDQGCDNSHPPNISWNTM